MLIAAIPRAGLPHMKSLKYTRRLFCHPAIRTRDRPAVLPKSNAVSPFWDLAASVHFRLAMSVRRRT